MLPASGVELLSLITHYERTDHPRNRDQLSPTLAVRLDKELAHCKSGIDQVLLAIQEWFDHNPELPKETLAPANAAHLGNYLGQRTLDWFVVQQNLLDLEHRVRVLLRPTIKNTPKYAEVSYGLVPVDKFRERVQPTSREPQVTPMSVLIKLSNTEQSRLADLMANEIANSHRRLLRAAAKLYSPLRLNPDYPIEDQQSDDQQEKERSDYENYRKRIALLKQGLDNLPEEDRTLLEAYDAQQVKVSELATKANCTLQQMYTRLRAIRKKAQEPYDQYLRSQD